MPGGFRLLIRKAFQRQHRAVGKMLVVGSLRNVSPASPCRCRPLEHDGGAILAVPVRWLTGVELLVARTRDGPRGPRSTGSFDRLFGSPSPNGSKYPFFFFFSLFFFLGCGSGTSLQNHLLRDGVNCRLRTLSGPALDSLGWLKEGGGLRCLV